MKILYAIAAAALLLAPSLAPAESHAGSEALFPRPAELEGDVRFWRRVYTEVGTDGGFIHDSRDLRVVYAIVKFPDGASPKGRERLVERKKREIRDGLRVIARGKRKDLNGEERRLLALFPEGVGNDVLRTATGNIRFQLGQADKFRAGLIRSGAWRAKILATLRELGLPEDLVALPHVESSYTPHAYSRVGAAGLWQFTRSTGRRYMRVDEVVDERMDPLVATIAAARLLQHNKKSTGTWPLALTAYNHGAAGMRRAARNVGTTDIAVIARKYKSRTFGFASRNFYVEFLAALEVDRNAERYFGVLPFDEPVEYDQATVPAYVPVSALTAALGVDSATLKRHNPALRSSVWSGSKRVPKNFEVRLPRNHLSRPLASLLATLPDAQRYAKQTRDSYHTVRRGESLSAISARYGVSVDALARTNNLRSRHSIRSGQKLRLPQSASRSRGSQQASIAVQPIPAPVDGVYTVRRGDTVSRIASRYGVSEPEILRWNGIANRNRIHVGQRLHVAEAAVPAASAPPPVPLPEPTPEPLPIAEVPPPPSSRAEFGPEIGPQVETVGLAETNPEPGTASTLQADPSDYSVASDGSIEVQATETLGHYAEWLKIRASRLRSMNGMSYRTPLVVGERLGLDFSKVSQENFEERRAEYHQALQQTFFDQHEIAGTQKHSVRSGDSIWTIAKQRYDVPLWLVRQYNPDIDFANLHAGEQLTIPTLRPRPR